MVSDPKVGMLMVSALLYGEAADEQPVMGAIHEILCDHGQSGARSVSAKILFHHLIAI